MSFPSAKEARREILKGRLVFLVNDVLTMEKMSSKNIDIPKKVLEATNGITDSQCKALILSGVAEILSKGGQADKAEALVIEALGLARLGGRETFLETIASGASTIAAKDHGELLWRVYEKIDYIEKCFPVGSTDEKGKS